MRLASDIHLGHDASETTVKRLPLADYGGVYFATHGLVAGDVKALAFRGFISCRLAQQFLVITAIALAAKGANCDPTAHLGNLNAPRTSPDPEEL